MYCKKCGAAMEPEAQFCPRCGQSGIDPVNAGGSDWLTTLLLCVVVGTLGVHRFYTGHIGIGVLQLLTGGGCGIWWIIDLIFIVTGSYTDVEGRPLFKKL